MIRVIFYSSILALWGTREEAEADLKNFPKKGKLETDGEVFEICTRK